MASSPTGDDTSPSGRGRMGREPAEDRVPSHEEVFEERVLLEQRVHRRVVRASMVTSLAPAPRKARRRRGAVVGLTLPHASRRSLAGDGSRGRVVSCRSRAHSPTRPEPGAPTMSVITFHNVEKSYGGQRLFAGAAFAIDGHDHAVLVGRNGSGKTTILRLMAGTEQPDAGTIARARGRRIWLHEQTPELVTDRPVGDYLAEAFGDAVALEGQLRATEEAIACLDEHSPELRDTMRAYQQLQRRFEELGGYAYRSLLAGVVEGLGLPEEMLERGLHSLSGGELTRVTLARALLADADLLLLDEPTNHLDIDSVEWLEQFLLELPASLRPRHARPPAARARGPTRALGRARARRDDHRRFRDLRPRAGGGRRPSATSLRAGPREDRAAAALLRPLPRQEEQGETGQGEAHADRAHQGRDEGAAARGEGVASGLAAAQALGPRGARDEGAGDGRRLGRRARRRPNAHPRRRPRAGAWREGRARRPQRRRQDDAGRDRRRLAQRRRGRRPPRS